MRFSRRRFVHTLAAAAVSLSVGTLAHAGNRDEAPQSRFREGDQTVDLFAGMESGQLNVKFIAKSAQQARIVVTNNSDQPLNVRLPETFAGAPVLAQNGFFGPGPGFGQNNGGAQGQTIGGGVFNNNGGNAQQGNNFFFMNIPPERFDDIEVAVVCLEHGKPDPRPAMEYEIKPLEQHTSNAAVHELMRQFARGKVPHASVQAAAWHLENKMSWQELAALTVKRHPTIARPGPISMFHARELEAAKSLVAAAQQRAARSQESTSPGESLSEDR